MEYKVGDRVVWVCNDEPTYHGTVIVERNEDGWYGVCFDEDIGGHDLNGLCPNGHGFWMPPGLLRRAPSLLEDIDIGEDVDGLFS